MTVDGMGRGRGRIDTHFQPIYDVEPPFLVRHGHVSAPQPATLQHGLLCSLLVPPVPWADVWSLDVYLSSFPSVHLHPVLVDQFDLAIR